MSGAVHELVLSRHPQSRAGAPLGVRARLRRAGHALSVRYVVEGELERVRMPHPATPRFSDDLWKHTCLELFLAGQGTSAYHEFNFSPSGAWAAYAFARYRERMPFELQGLDPLVEVRRSGARLQLDARISLDRLSPAHERGALSIGVSAVIEHEDGALSYWALRHRSGKPDFHHPDCFAAVLE